MLCPHELHIIVELKYGDNLKASECRPESLLRAVLLALPGLE